MAIYDWVESPGTALQERPRVAATRFGDGYQERAPDGLNPITQVWTVQHRNVDDEVADAIVAFLRARITAVAGQEAFEWWPPRAAAAIRVTCSDWSRTLGERVDTSTITATFEQVHEP